MNKTDDRQFRRKTALIPDYSSHLRLLVHNTTGTGTDDLPSHKPELILSIRGMTTHYHFDKKLTIMLGRIDASNLNNDDVDVDLTPYSAYERGVSRLHMLMQLFPGNRIEVMDMGSSNGTHLSGKPLIPLKFYLLHDYDYLVLGRLPVQVHFQ